MNQRLYEQRQFLCYVLLIEISSNITHNWLQQNKIHQMIKMTMNWMTA